MSLRRRVVEFWSSTEYAGFLGALMDELRGWDYITRQHFAVSQKKYWAARSRWQRWGLRLQTYAWYPLKIGARFAGPSRGLIGVICTNTFYAPAFALVGARRRVPIVHWVFDLFPEVLTVAGVVVRGGIIDGISRYVVKRTFSSAAANVFLGERLRRHAELEFGPIPNSWVIPIGADGRPFRNSPPERRERVAGGGDRRILYCGNFGRMHDAETIASAVRAGLPAGLRIEFRGNGPGFRMLEAAAASSATSAQIIVGGNLPENEWVSAMKGADVALATMRPEARGLVIPSKAYSALVAGQAILAICSDDTDLADLVRQHRAGWVVAPGDTKELQRVLQVIATNHDEVFQCRMRAFDAGHSLYDYRAIAPRWNELLETVSRTRDGEVHEASAA